MKYKERQNVKTADFLTMNLRLYLGQISLTSEWMRSRKIGRTLEEEEVDKPANWLLLCFVLVNSELCLQKCPE